MTRPPSSAQIRAHASRAFRNRQHAQRQLGAWGLRAPAVMETPLSLAEVAFGLERGLIAPRQVQR
jgi:hypothetical protein